LCWLRTDDYSTLASEGKSHGTGTGVPKETAKTENVKRLVSVSLLLFSLIAACARTRNTSVPANVDSSTLTAEVVVVAATSTVTATEDVARTRETDAPTPKTVIEFRIPLDSGDAYDKVLVPNGRYKLIAAASDQDDPTSADISRAIGAFELK
jgi:hypothetical protein